MPNPVDLRSDTLTLPTPEMRRAMAEAELGDDVFGEDPTVNRLQETVAKLLGKEAAMYVPSGTMANQLSIRSHTSHADEVFIEATSHPVTAEAGGAAALSGVQFRTLPGDRGILTAEQIEAAIRPPDIHRPPTRLICLENTHNFGGGSIFPLDEIAKIREIALKNDFLMHLDGARLMNACVASGVAPRGYAGHFDSVSICLSKGLGAPVGSVLSGSADFITRARRFRKMFGGGMRQAGVLAAAGLYAVENNIERLADDHKNAARLAQAISELKGIDLNPEHVPTNIVIMNIAPSGMSPVDAMHALHEAGVRVLPFGPTLLRAVTHLGVDEEGIERAIDAFKKVFG